MTVRQHQRGAALIIVLLVVALLTVTAVNIGDQVRFGIQRLSNQSERDQAWWYALGAEDLTREVIAISRDDNTTHLDQPWAKQGVLFPIDGGLISGTINDLQACFNINRLASGSGDADQTAKSPAARQFERLAIDTGVDSRIAGILSERVIDWIDSNQIPTGFNGAEDLLYTGLTPPYQTPNQLMVSSSEINLLLPGEEPLPAALGELLCALPATDTTLNINTLPQQAASVLAALLGDAFNSDDAAALLAQRPDGGWQSVDEALTTLGEREKQVDEAGRAAMGVKSDWFLADVAVQHYNARVRVKTRFAARGNTVVSYARSYGELF